MTNPALLPEKNLLIQLQAGSQSAFELLYNLYSKRIYRKILGLVKIADTADELTQVLFVKIWNKRQIVDPDKNFEAFLYQISQNLVMDFYRKAKRDKQLQDQIISISTELYSHTEEHIFYKESKAVIDQAIEKLPPQQQQVFKLCKIEGKSYEEVGQLLGISRSTVSNHIGQAHKSIKLFIFQNEQTALIVISAVLLDRF